MRKRQRKPRVEVTLPTDEDARLEALTSELDMSKAEVLLLGLSEEGREKLHAAETRITLRRPHLRNTEAALTSPANRARAQRSLRHLESKPTAEQKAEEARREQAKILLGSGQSFYEVERATGLSRKEVTQLELQRRAQNEARTRSALDEMTRRLDQAPAGQGRDELARRIAVLRGEQEEDEEPEQRYSSLHELNVDAVSRLFY